MKSYPKRSEVSPYFHSITGISWQSCRIRLKIWERLNTLHIYGRFQGFSEILILGHPTTSRLKLSHFFEKIISTEYDQDQSSAETLPKVPAGRKTSTRIVSFEYFWVDSSSVTSEWNSNGWWGAWMHGEMTDKWSKFALKLRFEAELDHNHKETNQYHPECIPTVSKLVWLTLIHPAAQFGTFLWEFIIFQ